MRRPRLQYGGVYLDKRYGIWYFRRSDLSDHPKPANGYHLKTGQRE